MTILQAADIWNQKIRMRLPIISVAQTPPVLWLIAMGQTLAALYLVVNSVCFNSLDVRSDHLWAVTRRQCAERE